MRSLRSLVREIHLLCGLTLALAVLFYAVSGAAIIQLIPLPRDAPRVTTERIPLPPVAAANADGLRAFMEAEVGARGRTQGVESLKGGKLRLRYTRPGTAVEAEVSPDRSELTVTTTSYGGFRVFRILHTLTGYAGGPAFISWSILLDLVALAMIGFAGSGIFLWYRLVKDRRLGWLILGGSWCYTLGLIAYLVLT